MKIRKLDRQEHGKTRELYEKVFCEDTKEFVDYYYSWKIRDNKIFVAEDERGIHAMLHLNPFHVYVNGKIEKLHYIVAVATQEEYRHQGLMRRLLEAAEQEMTENGELFTFLMPASEKIYLPFGYRYFTEQKQEILRDMYETGFRSEARHTIYAAEAAGALTYRCRAVKATEFQQLADLVNQILREQYDIFVWRDASYYERLCMEQTCQNGAVMAVVCSDENGEEQLIGTFCTACEEEGTQETVYEALADQCASGEVVQQETVYEALACPCVSEKTVQPEGAVHIRELILEPDHCKAGLETVAAFCRMYGVRKIEGFNGEMPEGGAVSESTVPLLMGKIICRQSSGAASDLAAKRIFINEVV